MEKSNTTKPYLRPSSKEHTHTHTSARKHTHTLTAHITYLLATIQDINNPSSFTWEIGVSKPEVGTNPSLNRGSRFRQDRPNRGFRYG